MNSPIPAGSLAMEAEALLQKVTSDRDRRCAALRAAADAKAGEIVACARAEALANVRKAIAQERGRLDQGLRQAEARAELEASRREQQESQVLLSQMWAESVGALERRWADPVHRRVWVEAAINQTGILLAGRPWRIEHGAGWMDDERGHFERLAARHGSGPVEWALDAGMRAGLRIRTERVCVDATIAALLVRRDEIESAFLAEYVVSASGGPP